MRKFGSFASLFLSFFGTALLGYSFQATSSAFEWVRASDGREAICAGTIGLFAKEATTGGRVGMAFGFNCPQGEKKPLAAVFVDHPKVMPWGWFLVALGFFVQIILTLTEPNVKPLTGAERKLLRQVIRIQPSR